ncbi:MAG: NUDIX domain-containing protein [Flavobacteriaceae bacterium]|nr:NUDIX domain-containing protein [Flavobacteriaceae bacterium]
MYKIFVNDKPIILTSKVGKESDFQLFLLNTADIYSIIFKLNKGHIKAAYLYHPDESQLLKIFIKKTGLVIAGGGLVVNDNGELLFIERNDKWDLPKGRAEKNEDIEVTALREVEEETGVQNLKMDTFLRKTYHIVRQKGKFQLKITYWYLMRTDYKGELAPQLEEGITKAVWKSEKKSIKALDNAYANVKLLVEAYLS